jgi:hypothetical protein
MKTRRFEIALGRERLVERASQATGFVSRIMVSREGGGTVLGAEISRKLCHYDIELVGQRLTVCDSYFSLCSVNAVHGGLLRGKRS